MSNVGVDLSKPRYDQSTFLGRYWHFRETASVSNIFVTKRKMSEAERLLQQYKDKSLPPEVTADDLWRAKRLYDSSHHPETGEKMFIMGRMSFQAPGNMVITGLLNTYRRDVPQIVLQILNQSFNAVVTYSNRGGDDKGKSHLFIAFLLAVGTATTMAYRLPRTQLLAKLRKYPMFERTVPLTAVISANMVNIPCMRIKELKEGIKVVDDQDNKVATSKVAARYAVAQTVTSRVLLATIVMGLPVGIMYTLEKTAMIKVLTRIPVFNPVAQIVLVGLSLVIGVPPCLAIFPQKGSLAVNALEHSAQELVKTNAPHIQKVYYNKGL